MGYEGTEAKFTCTASTDPEEVQNLEIIWKKDGEVIDYAVAQRMFRNDMDNSLTISGTISLDTGKYTCMAYNGLDWDEMSAQLVVQAPPDPPTNVQVECRDQERIAEVTWHPGKENYAPVLNFILQFNTTFSPDTWFDIASNISQNERRVDVSLSPYGNYTFRVLARNKIGLSQPSKHTEHVCKTVEAVPDKNPENVMGEGDEPNNLVIFWTPMPKIEQNGRDFKYIISWWRADVDNAEEKVHTIERAEYYHYVVPTDQPTYVPFWITVKSENAVGPSSIQAQKIKGYSGEDAPNSRVTDLMSVPDSVKGTEVTLMWTHVDTDPDVIRGFFRGYRIQFWKTADGEDYMREDDYIINATTQYPRPRYRRAIDENNIVTYVLKNLPPYSDITIQIRILNKYYAGPPSERIYIDTIEGEPGPPASFDVIARGSTHFELEWTRPVEENGVLVGYNISYQRIMGLNLGRLAYREPITNPDTTRARLTGLQPFTDYRVYLAAATAVGMGESIFLDGKTTQSGTPNPPTFIIDQLGDTWVYLKWEPSRGDNPGSVFYVQYRPRSSYHWLASPDETLHYASNVTELFTGTTYQIRVVSKNGEGYEAPSEWQEFTTGGVAPGRIELASAGWFYGIFAALLLIVLIMIGFILLKRKRDEWWDNKEAEINEQMRQLQAEEAARQLGFGGGIDNAYADTGSREMLADSSHADLTGSITKQPIDDEPRRRVEDEEEEDDDEDDEDGSEYTDDSEEEDDQYNPRAAKEREAMAAQRPGYLAESQVGYRPPPQQPQAGFHPGYTQPQQSYQQPPPEAGYYAPPPPQQQQQQRPPQYQLEDPSSPDGRHGSSFV